MTRTTIAAALWAVAGCKDAEVENDKRIREEAKPSLALLGKLLDEPQGLPPCDKPAASPVLVTSRYVIQTANDKPVESAKGDGELQWNRERDLPPGDPCVNFDVAARSLAAETKGGKSVMSVFGVHRCLKSAKSVAVFRSTEWQAPTVNGSTFTQGKIEGVVTVYDASGKGICSSPVSARSSSGVDVYGKDEVSAKFAVEEDLRANLRKGVFALVGVAAP